MTKKNRENLELSTKEKELIEQLREHPDVMERVQSILAITDSSSGVKRADEIEGLLVDEMRRLGNTTMSSWAARAEERLGEDLKQKDTSASVRKKKR